MLDVMRILLAILLFLELAWENFSFADEWTIDIVARGGWDSGVRAILHSNGEIAVFEGYSSKLFPCLFRVDDRTLKVVRNHVETIMRIPYRLPEEDPRKSCADETRYRLTIWPKPKHSGQPPRYGQQFSGVRECAAPDLPEEWFSLAEYLGSYAFERLEQCRMSRKR